MSKRSKGAFMRWWWKACVRHFDGLGIYPEKQGSLFGGEQLEFDFADSFEPDQQPLAE